MSEDVAVTEAPGGSTPAPPPAPRRRPSPGRIAGVAAAALAAGALAVGIAAVLDEPVGGGARDRAPIIVGQVIPPGQELTGQPDTLPPLSIVLDRPAPAGISSLPAEQQVVRLRELTATSGEARRFLELGRAYMELDDVTSARDAFSRAALLLPRDPAPLVGLAMLEGLEGDAGLDRAGEQLAALSARFPRSQVVAFNRGWLAVYRRDPGEVVSNWQRAVQLGPRTPLGRTAADLLTRVRQAGG